MTVRHRRRSTPLLILLFAFALPLPGCVHPAAPAPLLRWDEEKPIGELDLNPVCVIHPSSFLLRT